MGPAPPWHDDEEDIVEEVIVRKLVRRGERFWRKHLEQWGSSGLSQQQYCSQHGIALSSFQRWRRTLGDVRAKAAVEIVPVLSLAPRPLPQLPLSVSITVACGPYRVEVPRQFDRVHLATVLDVLEERRP